ncbi:MAG: hypothetical protein J5605_05445 [Bacteroidales bacterium]|nr:hypothetical protein [Bacteroidales bacterium]
MKNDTIPSHCHKHALFTLFFVTFVMICFSAKAQLPPKEQRDSLFHVEMLEKMEKAKTPLDRARLYYQDFIYANYGIDYPYLYSDDYYSGVHRTPTFPNGADSALVLLRQLYDEDENQFMYYPICQLEHYLCKPHYPAIKQPDTTDFYIPLRSGSSADLGKGWQSNYTQHLLTRANWALSHCYWYTKIFKAANEPSIWIESKKNPQFTALRITISHLPGTSFTMYRVDMRKGKPYAIRKEGYHYFHTNTMSYTPIFTDSTTIRLSSGRWEKLQSILEKFDTLDWYNEGITIDGHRNFCEYAHDGNYHSYYSCGDRTTDSVAKYLYSFFKKPNTVSVRGEVCAMAYDKMFGNIRNRLDSVEVRANKRFSVKCVAKTSTANFKNNIFRLELPVGNYRLSFKCPGYKNETIKNISITGDTLVNVMMTPKNLEAISVNDN